MSDYGDDYSDYGEEWLYVEDEYMAADDLAEHTVHSPPRIVDDDDVENWDMFEYFNDLEYASDGYYDGDSYTHNSQAPGAGRKRKRGIAPGSGQKRRRLDGGHAKSLPEDSHVLPPVTWRSQKSRNMEPAVFDEQKLETYALFKDWRDRLSDTPAWTTAGVESGNLDAPSALSAPVEDPNSLPREFQGDHDEEDDEGAEIDPSVLMELLNNKLTEEGGPLAGLDKQQLLQSVMRMMSSAGSGDDIAGELADQLLQRGEDEDDDENEEAPEEVMDWLEQHRETVNSTSEKSAPPTSSTPKSTKIERGSKQPPTPPSIEANRSVRLKDDATAGATQVENAESSKQNSHSIEVSSQTTSRKRKAPNETHAADNVQKKRVTKSYEAPTTASKAKTSTEKGRSSKKT